MLVSRFTRPSIREFYVWRGPRDAVNGRVLAYSRKLHNIGSIGIASDLQLRWKARVDVVNAREHSAEGHRADSRRSHVSRRGSIAMFINVITLIRMRVIAA